MSAAQLAELLIAQRLDAEDAEQGDGGGEIDDDD